MLWISTEGMCPPPCPCPPKLTLHTPDPCKPCCRPFPLRFPSCPPISCFPKVCCPAPCCPYSCIRPVRNCFIPPPCCKKMCLVVSPPVCPPRCCPPCHDGPDPCKPANCGMNRTCPCPDPCSPTPNFIVRPIRYSCCPPRRAPSAANCCPTPCWNPMPLCCVMVKPCKTSCQPGGESCPPSPLCCPAPFIQADPRSCPKPLVLSFKCPTATCPMPQASGCESSAEVCKPSCCPPKQDKQCFVSVRPCPPTFCFEPPGPCC